jgi:cell division protein FtsB
VKYKIKTWFSLSVSTVLPEYEELQSKRKNLEQLEVENQAKDDAIKDLKRQLEILMDKSSDYVRVP